MHVCVRVCVCVCVCVCVTVCVCVCVREREREREIKGNLASYLLLWHIPISLSVCVNGAQGSSVENLSDRKRHKCISKDRSQSVNRELPFSASYAADGSTAGEASSA